MTRTIQFKANGWVFTVHGELVTATCCACGIPFAIPSEFQQWLRADPTRGFYCPNGHLARHMVAKHPEFAEPSE